MNPNDPDYIPDEVCLDKCACGCEGKFIKGDPSFREIHAAYCINCGYTTAGYPKQYQAMCEWNIRQRKERGVI